MPSLESSPQARGSECCSTQADNVIDMEGVQATDCTRAD
jgi:hypothetical protein